MKSEKLELSLSGFEKTLPGLIQRYLKLPNYTNVDGLLEKQNAIQEIHDPSANIYYENARANGWAAARDGQYDQAIMIVSNAFNELPNQSFSDHDKKAIEIFLLRRLGRIYEHQATFGEEKIPLTDTTRRMHFVNAACLYIQADIELGGITEFAGRAAEAFGGAGLHELSATFLRAFFGNNIIVNPSTDEVVTLISTLRKKGEETTGGATLTAWGKE